MADLKLPSRNLSNTYYFSYLSRFSKSFKLAQFHIIVDIVKSLTKNCLLHSLLITRTCNSKLVPTSVCYRQLHHVYYHFQSNSNCAESCTAYLLEYKMGTTITKAVVIFCIYILLNTQKDSAVVSLTTTLVKTDANSVIHRF